MVGSCSLEEGDRREVGTNLMINRREGGAHRKGTAAVVSHQKGAAPVAKEWINGISGNGGVVGVLKREG
jgi:hypothetical protein